MKKSSYLILTVALLILVVIFTLQNTEEVSIHILHWSLKTPLAILIFSMFAIGVVSTILFLTPSLIAMKIARAKSKKKISELEKQHSTDAKGEE